MPTALPSALDDFLPCTEGWAEGQSPPALAPALSSALALPLPCLRGGGGGQAPLVTGTVLRLTDTLLPDALCTEGSFTTGFCCSRALGCFCMQGLCLAARTKGSFELVGSSHGVSWVMPEPLALPFGSDRLLGSTACWGEQV